MDGKDIDPEIMMKSMEKIKDLCVLRDVFVFLFLRGIKYLNPQIKQKITTI